MRTISLVKRLKWSFTGNMNPHALVIGDVDNDNSNEFVIGNLNGDLAIFKGECSSSIPTYFCRGLGTITCIAIGDVQNWGKNSVVVINAEGHAHIFDIQPKNQSQSQHISAEDYLGTGRRTSDTASIQAFRRMMSGNGPTMPPPLNEQQQQEFNKNNTNQNTKHQIQDLEKPNITLKVPVNVNKILIADIDNDSLNELILARTDRILHAFQLVHSDVSTAAFEHMYKGIKTPSVASLSPSASTTSLSAMQDGAEEQPANLNKGGNSITERATLKSQKSTFKKQVDDVSEKQTQLLDKNMWVFDGQISSLCTSTHPDRPHEPLLLVAQPGNTFTIIDQDGKRYNRDFTPQYAPTTIIPNYQKPEGNEKEEARLPNAATKTIEIHEHKVKDDAGNSFNRSNYVVQNWPVLEGGTNNEEEEDEQDAEESGAVATEIVVGKRYDTSGYSTSEIGMLSMDGKFSIYDLKSKTTSQRDLFVTHKLFSLATLNVSNRVEEVHNTNTNTAHQHLHSHYQHSSFKSSQHPRSTNSLLSASGSRHSSKLSLVTPDYPNSISNRRKSHHNNASSDTDNDDGYDEEEDAYSEANDEDYTDDDDDNLINEEEDDSDYESVPWSEKSETEEAPDCDLFVACAWNGVTYLIDWSKRIDDDDESSSQSSSASESGDELQPLKSKIKYQLVKFAFEGRVCAFTAGLYAVKDGVNVPCLFYVDFEDQIYVYYDVRITPGPVNGFIDNIDDDIEEALDRIMGIESNISHLTKSASGTPAHEEDTIDLGDGWKGIDGDPKRAFEVDLPLGESDTLDLADFIHECLYGFDEMKDKMEEEMLAFKKSRLSNSLPPEMDVRRLSDLNITIEPSLDNNAESIHNEPYPASMTDGSSESFDEDDHVSSWMKNTLLNSSIFNKDDDDDEVERSSALSDSS